MAQVKGQSTENKIVRRLRGSGRGSIVFQQDYADCGTPSAGVTGTGFCDPCFYLIVYTMPFDKLKINWSRRDNML